MNGPDRRRQLELVAEANRAPSAHNTQPARWRFLPDGDVELYEDTARRLPVADPRGRDQRIALGSAFEGLRLALARDGQDLLELRPASDAGDGVPGTPGLRLVGRARMRPGGTPDPLAAYVPLRHTYRGPFQPAGAEALGRLRSLLDRHPEVIGVYEPATIADLAERSDRAGAALLAGRELQAELYRWIRFSPRDPRWTRDGLTSDCLALSRIESAAARWLMAPHRFAALARLGLHAPLVAEARRIRTATALAILHQPDHESGLGVGRAFYRLWLEITRAGFSARPMSALADEPGAVAYLHRCAPVPAGATVINVFAIGLARAEWRRESPRLPPEELLVD